MPDFIGDKEEVTHSGSCATCKFGKPSRFHSGVLCHHKERQLSYLKHHVRHITRTPLMQPTDVCELWEAQ